MDRAFASGSAGAAPAAPASPSIGYPTAGNPALAVPATKPGPYWYHMITEEMRAVIVAAGVDPDHEDLTQLKQALDELYMSKSSAGSASAQDFRLTLVSDVPVTTADVNAATTLYLTPYKGSKIALYSGTAWSEFSTAQLSIAIPATTSTVYDVFAYNNAGTPELELLAWTNGTTRATALAYQDGVLCKSGALTRRYLGTIRTTGVSGQCEDSLSNRLVWNYNNRVDRQARGTFSADRATTSTTYVELNSEIRMGFVIGVSEDALALNTTGSVAGDANRWAGCAFAFDSTTAEPGLEGGAVAGGALGAGTKGGCTLVGYKTGLAAGYHYATILGKTDAGTCTWQSATGSLGAKFYANLSLKG